MLTLLKENAGEYLCDTKVGKDFLPKIQNALTLKENCELYHVKIKTSHSSGN